MFLFEFFFINKFMQIRINIRWFKRNEYFSIAATVDDADAVWVVVNTCIYLVLRKGPRENAIISNALYILHYVFELI